jgi:DNA-binding NtrC family response regulator
LKSKPLSTRVVEGGAARLEIDGAELRVVGGPDRGLKVTLGADSLRIGTAPDCELVVHDPTVSTRHAEIAVTRHGYLIRDLHSKNGVLIGRVPIERAYLVDGLRVELGETVLTVHATGDTQSIALSAPGRFGEMIAYSLRMRAVAAELERLARSETTILLEGETGTGKEVAARAIHAASNRSGGPFVVLDCGAFPHGLLAAELFGHERGAFTGAEQARAGLFEQAEGGTLFLDEIGEMALDLQPVLLRALESRRTRRVGGQREIAHDVRLLAATNRNLAEEVKTGRFRQDLFFRLAVARVRLPSLRDRPEDIPVLAGMFAAEVGFAIPPELLSALEAHPWPGNVRELRNTIHSAAAGAASPFAVDRAPAEPPTFRDGDRVRSLPEARHLAIDEFEKSYLEALLVAAGGVVSRAADLAGVSRQLLTRLLAKHRLRVRDRFPDQEDV